MTINRDDDNEKESLPSFHLKESYPDATSIFRVSLPPVEEVRDNALIVLDTNVLLVPYTINPKSLDEIKRTYIRLIDEKRLFVPAQVAREFAKNRAGKIGELFQQFSRKRNRLDTLQAGRYPLLESLAEYNDLINIEKEIDEKIKEYRKTIGSVLNHIRGWRWNDSVSVMYRELFIAEVIIDNALTENELEADLGRRLANRIPPGFKDSSKDDNGIGDLIIWQTILSLGKERKRNVVFVSGEEKTDWWHRSENEALYPRFELVDEYSRISEGKSFHIVKFSQLLDLFGAEEQLVEEVRKKEIVQPATGSREDFLWRVARAEQATEEWLVRRFSPITITKNEREFPDFKLELSSGKRLGVEIKTIRQPHNVPLMHRDVAYRAYYEMNENRFDDFVLVFVAGAEDIAKESTRYLERRRRLPLPAIGLVVGYLDSDNNFIATDEDLNY